MVRLRKSYNKLKIILCCILGAVVALGGVVCIWWLNSLLTGEKEIIRPDNTVSYRKALPDGATYTQLRSDGIDTLGYLAYVLDNQPFYHSESNTQSTANIFPVPQYTDSYKDYKDGIMLSSDFTYGIISEGTQSCFVPEGGKDGKGAGVYMRTSVGAVDEDTTGTTAEWGEGVTYYDREKYLFTYGEYSTEMTVYILNSETVVSWDEVVENGDGTYSQKFYLDAEKACYYYQYAMKTRGGLDRLPVFESISLDVTFDDYYRVLKIDVVENSQITRFQMSMSSVSQTSTVYSYTEESFDQPHRDLYEDYYSQFVGELDSDGGEEELDPLTLLMSSFAGVLSGEGQQFETSIDLGGKTYYGRIFLSVDMNSVGSDILGAIEARIALSADEDIDGQDLYICLSGGKVEGYYSKDFALTADVGSFGEIIDKFTAWADGLTSGGASVASEEGSGEEGGSLDDILNQLLGGLKTEETAEGLTLTLDIDDLMGIGISARLDFISDGAGYIFKNAEIGGLSYGGQNIDAALSLSPSSAEIISHEKAEAPFDVNKAAENLYQLLSSKSIRLELSAEGEKLADLLASIGVFDAGDALDAYRLEISGAVEADGVTVNAGIRLLDGQKELLCADVYYVYNDAAGKYGTAYLNIKNILGAAADVKVYCDIAELASAVEEIVAMFTSPSAETYAAGTDIAGIINGVLSLDFGTLIREVYANSALIGATVNADEVFALLGVDISLGDITLEYSLGEFEAEDYNAAGGLLYGSIPSAGVQAYIYGSTAGIADIQKDEYLDLTQVVNSALAILSDGQVGIDITVKGDALADLLAPVAELGNSIDGMVLTVTGAVNVNSLTASAGVKLTEGSRELLAANVYYDYNAGEYGTAYIAITNLLGAKCDVYVYGDIEKTVANIKALIGSMDNGTATYAEEGNEVADIIAKVLAIDFAGIIEELKVNANGMSTVIDADKLISEFAVTEIKVGKVTLSYSDGKLTGYALDGGFEMEVVKGAQVSKPAGDYLDINTVLNAVKQLLASPRLSANITLTGDSLNTFLAASGLGDYASILTGTVLQVSGNVDVSALKASAHIALYKADYTYLSADVYYNYAEGEYGTAYITFNALLGKELGGEVKLKCNISDTIETVKQLMGSIEGIQSYSAEEDKNELADIIGGILGLDLNGMVEELTLNASAFTTTLDLDKFISAILGIATGESEQLPVQLGKATLSYSDGALKGDALNGGLELTVSKGSEVTAPADDYFDISELLSLAQNILSGQEVGIDITVKGEALADLLAPVAELGTSIDGMVLIVTGAVNVNSLTASAGVKLTEGNRELLAASVYYDYNAGEYGTAYIAITNLLGAKCDVYVYGDIEKIVANIKALIGSMNGNTATYAEEGNEVADIIAKVLAIDFAGIIEELKVNANGMSTIIDADKLISEFAVTEIKVGKVTLSYSDGKLTGSALNEGLVLTAGAGKVEKPDVSAYLDINTVLNAVQDMLSGQVGIDIELAGDALADLLGENQIAELGGEIDGLVLNISGNVSVSELAAELLVELKDENKVYVQAGLFYDYNGEGYGEVYLTITHLLGASLETPVKVCADISDAAETVRKLIEDINGMTSSFKSAANEQEENSIANIISQIASVDLTEIITKLSINADGMATSIDGNELLGFIGVQFNVGEIRLIYSGGELKGSALNGGLDVTVKKGEELGSYRADEYLDIVKLLSSVTDLLSGGVEISVSADGKALAQIADMAGAGLGDSLNGITLKLNGMADVNTLSAGVNALIVGAEGNILLDADIYYSYAAGTYGTVYLSLNTLLCKQFTPSLKVYGDISSAAEKVGALISEIEKIVSSVPVQGFAANSGEDGATDAKTVADIVRVILGIDFAEACSLLSVNADGFETTLDLGYILRLAGVELELGDIYLKYNMSQGEGDMEGRLEGSAFGGGLNISVGKGSVPEGPSEAEKSEYADLNALLSSVTELLGGGLFNIDISVSGAAATKLLECLGITECGDSLSGLSLAVRGTADINSLTASLEINVESGGASLFTARALYSYDSAYSRYGEVYLYISTLLQANCDIKVYGDIEEVAAAVKQLISSEDGSGQTGTEEGGSDIAEIIANVLAFDLGSVLEQLTQSAGAFSAHLSLDGLVAALGGSTAQELGSMMLVYDMQRGALSGSAFEEGIKFALSAGDGVDDFTKGERNEYQDIAALISSVTELLSGNVAVDIELTGASLEEFLRANGYVDLGGIFADATLTLRGDVDVKALTAELTAELCGKVNGGDYTYLSADVYYNYAEGEYGTAYITFNALLNKQFNTPVKLKCNISDMVETVKQLIGSIEGIQSYSVEEEANGLADIIGGILGLDLNGMVEELTLNASAFTTTLDLDKFIPAILGIATGESEQLPVQLGKATLTYSDGELKGNALNGGLELTVSKGSEVTAPADDYFDISELLSLAQNILSGQEVGIDITVKGEALADLLAPVAELGTSIDGMVLIVTGAVNVNSLTASAGVKLTEGNRELLAASVYYDYNAGEYGTAYIAITNLLGAKCDVYVYGDIEKTVANIKALIGSMDNGTATYAEESDEVADIIAKVLAIDFAGIIEELKVNANGMSTIIDADKLISEFAATEIKVGKVTLSYSGGKLTGFALNKGLVLTAGAGKVEKPDVSAYLDVNTVLNAVQDMINGQVGIDIELTGASLEEFLNANGYVDLGGIFADATLTLYGDVDVKTLTAELAAELCGKVNGGDYTYLSADVYYNYAEGEYGTAYITFNALLNKQFNTPVKLKCNISDTIETVKQLIGSIEGIQSYSVEEDKNGLADIIGGILGLELNGIVEELTLNANAFTATLDLDKFISAILGIATGESEQLPVQLGKATLTYSDGALKGNALNGGLKLTVTKGGEVTGASGDYLDVADIIKLIDDAVKTAGQIAQNRTVDFAIDAVISLNEVNFLAVGEGRIGWDESGVVTYVALKLSLCLYTGDISRGDKTLTDFRFEYNGSAEGDEPFIRIAVNSGNNVQGGNMLTVSRNQAGSVSSFIGELKDIIAAISGGAGAQGIQMLADAAGNAAASSNMPAGEMTPAVNTKVIELILNVLSGEGLGGDLFGALMAGDIITVEEIEGALAVNLFGLNLSVRDGKFVAEGSVKIDGNTVLEVKQLAVSAGVNGSACNYFEGFTQWGEGVQSSFARMIYEYVLGTLEGLDIGSFLGGKTYSVDFELIGNRSGIAALSGVNVKATLYFTDGVNSADTTKKENGKLAEADFDISVGSFSMSAGAVYMGRNIYIALESVNNIKLDLKVSASSDDIFAAVENVIELIKDPAVLSFFSGIASLGKGGTGMTLSEGEERTLADMLVTLLTFDYKSYVSAVTSADGSTVVVADVQGILALFGVNEEVGKAQLTLQGNGGIELFLAPAGESGNPDYSQRWISLDAGFEESTHAFDVNIDEYLDIGFVSDLVGDAGKFLSSNKTESGEISSLFTFCEDELKVSLDVSIITKDIVIKDFTLTVGLEDGELYLSLGGELQECKVIGQTVAAANYIGVTYRDGKLTLMKYKDNDRNQPIYWIMTPEYFIDHLFAKNGGNADSPLRWLLGTSDNLWATIVLFIGDSIDISSGLADPDVVDVFDRKGNDAAGSEFSIFDYIDGILVNIDGEEATNFNGGAVNTGALGVSGDFYGFSADLSSVIGDVFDDLDIALVRNDTTGIGALNAYTSVNGGMVTTSISLEYKNGAEPVQDYYLAALKKAEQAGNAVDFGYYDDEKGNDNSSDYADWIFGGVKVEGGLVYDYSEMLAKDYVTVYITDIDGAVRTEHVKYGSTLNLYDWDNIISVTEDGVQYAVVYVNEDTYSQGDDDLPTSIVADGSTIKTDENGERYIRLKAVKTSDRVVSLELYNVNSDGGIELIDGDYKLFEGDTIPVDVLSGYVLLGGTWYTDSTLSTPYGGAADGDMKLYGRFVDEVVTDSGVEYKFVDASGDVAAHYVVSGHDNSLALYYNEGTTLVLKNEIDGYPVTEIASNALQNTDSTLERGLQNVVVPENITKVGGRAFLDNYGIKSVVFLADTVTLEGNASDKTTPFYGCSKTDGGTESELTVYYNTIMFNGTAYNGNISATSNGGALWESPSETWTYFRESRGTVRVDYYYFGATSRSGWAYIDYNITLDGEEYDGSLGDLTYGLPAENTLLTSVTAMSPQGIADHVTALINEYTCREENGGYIGRYIADTAESIELNGRYTVNIQITDTRTEWYPVEFTYLVSSEDGAPVEDDAAGTYAFAEGCTQVFNGTTYVKQGEVSVNILPANNKYELVSVSVNGDPVYASEGALYVFEMPAERTDIVVDYNFVQAKTVSVYSAIPFSYNGEYAAGLQDVAVGEEETLLSPSAAGYVFLGWAIGADGSEELVFKTSDLSVEYKGVYYAVWAKSSREFTVTVPVADGTAELPQISATDGTLFYRWYNGTDFSTAYSGITTQNTVVTARWQFRFDFTLSGSNTKYYVTMNAPVSASDDFWNEGATGFSTRDSDKIDWLSDGKYDSVGDAVYVPEGCYIQVSRGDGANIIIIDISEKIGGESLYSLSVKGIKMKNNWIFGWSEDGDRAFFDGNPHLSESDIGEFAVVNSLVNNENRIWLTAENVDKDMEFKLVF